MRVPAGSTTGEVVLNGGWDYELDRLYAAGDTLYLVDGSSYIFRAYYAIRQLSTTSGLPTNAVYGFTTMILKLLRERKPERFVIAFDTARPSFRKELYAEYKANRPPPPEDLVPQFALVRTIPDECRDCAFVDTCQGGCAGRRALAGGIGRADPYCPLVRGETVEIRWTPAEARDLLKTGSACTTVLAPL